MNMYAIKVGTDDTIERLDFDTSDTLKVLQTAVGGYIEHIGLPFVNLDAWGNDEAAIVAEPEVNDIGSVALNQLAGWPTEFYGTLVFTGGADDEGNTLGLPEEQADDLQGYLEQIKASLPS
jgi:hypothetical protein